jgi:hypothetical protein
MTDQSDTQKRTKRTERGHAKADPNMQPPRVPNRVGKARYLRARVISRPTDRS